MDAMNDVFNDYYFSSVCSRWFSASSSLYHASSSSARFLPSFSFSPVDERGEGRERRKRRKSTSFPLVVSSFLLLFFFLSDFLLFPVPVQSVIPAPLSFACCDPSTGWDLTDFTFPTSFNWLTSTVEFWIGFGDVSYNAGIVVKGCCAGLQPLPFQTSSAAPYYLDFYVYPNTSAGHGVGIFPTPGLPGTFNWYHLAIVRTPLQTVDIYIDGSLYYSTPNVTLYAQEHDTSDPFHVCPDMATMILSEVRVWSVELTALQIATRFNTRLVGTEPNLFRYWPLSANVLSGNGAADLTPVSGTPGFTGVCNAIVNSLLLSPTPTASLSSSVSTSCSFTPSTSVTLSHSASASASLTPSRSASSSIGSSLSASTSDSFTPSTSVTLSGSASASLTPSRSASGSIASSLSVSVSTSGSFTPSISVTLSGSASASLTPFRSASSSVASSLSASVSIPPSSSKSPARSRLVPSAQPPTPTPKEATQTPFATPKSVPATTVPFEDDGGQTVVVYYCSTSDFPYGCNGKCVSSVSLCTDSSTPTSCSSASTCPIDKKDPEEEGRTDVIQVDIVTGKGSIELPVLNQDGHFVGSITVPRGTFPKGYIVRVSTFWGVLPEKEEEKQCDGEDKEKRSRLQRVAGIFDVSVFSPDGKEVELKKLVTVSHLVVLPKGEDPHDTCLSYNHDTHSDSSWKCDNKDVTIKKVNSSDSETFFLVSQDFDHFTGFTVLLGDPNPGCGEFSTLQWLTMGFLIGAGVVLTVACVSYYFYSKHLLAEQDSALMALSHGSRK